MTEEGEFMGAEAVQETTLDLDRIMDEGMAKFQGELIEAAREGAESSKLKAESEAGAITPKPDEKASPPGKGTGVGGQMSEVEGKETEDKGPKTGDAAGTREGNTPEGEKPKFRFKDHEAAEDGYRHLQAAKTKAEQEAARLRADLTEAQEAEERRKAQEKLDQDLTTFIAEQHEAALTKIDTLDPDAADYRKQVAMAWAEKDAAVKRWERTKGQESGVREQGSGVRGQESGAVSQTPDPNAVWAAVEQRAQSAGIDPSDDYFRMVCAQAPDHATDGTALPFDDQVKWAVDQTLAYHKRQEQRFQERLKADAKKRMDQDQAAALPLGKSPADRSAGKPPAAQVVTLNDALNAALEERRL